MSQNHIAPSTSDSASEPSSPPAFTAQAPFNSGDVILRSSDGVDFRVHRIVLSLASPVFASMFTLPQPGSEPDVPSIPMPESAITLDSMLRFWYPGAEPAPAKTFDELKDVLEILISKYDVQSVAHTAQAYLQKYRETHPVAVYSIACNYGWEDLARDAAWDSLKLPLRVFDYDAPSELNNITGRAYHRLLQYHHLCGVAAKGATSVLRWVTWPSTHVWFSCTSCTAHPLHWFLSDGTAHPVRVWFINYLTSVGAVLGATPGASLTNIKILNPALREATQCGTCRDQVHDQLSDFVCNMLEPQIKQVLAEIQLKF